jgi:hypothetical protein
LLETSNFHTFPDKMIWRPLHQKISQVLIIASRLFSTTLVGEKRNTELLTLIKIVTIKIESFIANYFFTYGVHNSHFFLFLQACRKSALFAILSTIIIPAWEKDMEETR